MFKDVYLAGPIAHLYPDQAEGWREQAIAMLADHGIRGRSPLRGKGPRILDPSKKIGLEAYEDPMASDSGIVARDHYDVTHADVIIANFLKAEQVSFGTPVEFGWAHDNHIPIISIIEEEGSPYDHPFFRGMSSYRVTSLEEAVYIAVVLLT